MFFTKAHAAQLARIEALLLTLTKGSSTTMVTIADLAHDVAAQSTIVTGVQTLIAGLVAQVQAAAGDPAQLAAVLAQIDANNATLSALIPANVPAQPAGPVIAPTDAAASVSA